MIRARWFSLALAATLLVSGCNEIRPDGSDANGLVTGKGLRESLIAASPWIVRWYISESPAGHFRQTFFENSDGKVRTTTDEVGPYETDVRFVDDAQAIWESPHGNVIVISVQHGKLVGDGPGDLRLTYSSRL